MKTIVLTLAALAFMSSVATAQQVHCRTFGNQTICQCYGKC